MYINYTACFITVYFINRWLAKGVDCDSGAVQRSTVREPTDREGAGTAFFTGAGMPEALTKWNDLCIEEVLYAHPSVAEASVIGVRDKVYGEDIKAFVTLKAGQSVTDEEIMEHCRGKLKKFFVPKEVVILKAMPKTLVGKILKKELRNMKTALP